MLGFQNKNIYILAFPLSSNEWWPIVAHSPRLTCPNLLTYLLTLLACLLAFTIIVCHSLFRYLLFCLSPYYFIYSVIIIISLLLAPHPLSIAPRTLRASSPVVHFWVLNKQPALAGRTNCASKSGEKERGQRKKRCVYLVYKVGHSLFFFWQLLVWDGSGRSVEFRRDCTNGWRRIERAHRNPIFFSFTTPARVSNQAMPSQTKPSWRIVSVGWVGRGQWRWTTTCSSSNACTHLWHLFYFLKSWSITLYHCEFSFFDRLCRSVRVHHHAYANRTRACQPCIVSLPAPTKRTQPLCSQ